jgi:transposase
MIGENHPRTKYSDAQIREMRALHANGLSYRKIAALFGANSSYVGEIVTRKTRIYVD